jgi:exopolysaccharide biosynthesis polyprenyl glycosylphosphotransferase
MFKPIGFRFQWAFLIAGDVVVAALATCAAFAARRPMPPPVHSFAAAFFFVALWIAAIFLFDLYRIDRPLPSEGQLVFFVIGVASVVGIGAAVGGVVVPGLDLGRRFDVAYLGVGGFVLLLFRIWTENAFSRRIKLGVMIGGKDGYASLLADEVARRRHLGYRLIGFFEHSPEATALSNGRVWNGATLYQAASLNALDSVPTLRNLVLGDDARAQFAAEDVLHAKRRGICVVDYDSFYERLTGRLNVSALGNSRRATAPQLGWPRWRARLKRIVDLVAASLLGVVAMPVALVTALAIKLDSPGPVLYTQDRVGADGRVFRVYKFRSMRLSDENDADSMWTDANDSRVTRVGRLIRKRHIDELPQLLNVLKGEMSLVGPRPQHPAWVEALTKQLPQYGLRHQVKPGITGWAQVCRGYGLTVQDHTEIACYDLYYIKNWSLAFDLQIILQTAKVVLLARGAH